MGRPRTSTATLAERHRAHDEWKGQGDWIPASGGTETPFVTRSGRRLLYVFQPRSGRHAYLDLGADLILTQQEADLAMGTRNNPKRRKGPFAGGLGTGERFAHCVETMRARRDVRDPAALCAWIGRRKYGRAGFAALGRRGRMRRNPSVDGYLVVLWQDAGQVAPHRTVLYEGVSRASASRTFRETAHTVRAASRDGVFRMVQFYAVVPDERDRQRAVLVDEVWGGGRSVRSPRARAHAGRV